MQNSALYTNQECQLELQQKGRSLLPYSVAGCHLLKFLLSFNWNKSKNEQVDNRQHLDALFLQKEYFQFQ